MGIFKSTLADPKANSLWVKNVIRNKIGQDVQHLVQDIRRDGVTSQKRDTTWAEGKDKVAKRRARNTMGLKQGLWHHPADAI